MFVYFFIMFVIFVINQFCLNFFVFEYDYLCEDCCLEGNLLCIMWNYFINVSGEMNVGIWVCEKGSWCIVFVFNKDEYFCVFEGCCCVIDE